MTKRLLQKYMRVINHPDFWHHDPKMALHNAWGHEFTNPLLTKNLKEFNRKYEVNLKRNELACLCELIDSSQRLGVTPNLALETYKLLTARKDIL